MATAVAVPATRDVEQVLREGGLSPFHRKAILVTGAAWRFVAMEILLVGFVAPIFAGLWNLDGRMQGLVNSAALAGSLCGSLVLGRAADRVGRRAIFQYSILWYAVFTALTALAWGPWSVMTFRFLAGLGLGAAPDDAEVRQLRLPAAQELRLPPLRFEQGHLSLGERRRERNPRRAAPGADVDDRAVEPLHVHEPAEGVVEQPHPSLVPVADRGQPGRLQDGLEPALEHSRRRHA